jgi:hypothetical protein
MTTTVRDTLDQVLRLGGGVVLDPAGPRMRASESLTPLVQAHRQEIRALLEMSLAEYAQRGMPLAVLVPWAPSQRIVLTPNVQRVPGVSRSETWTVGELQDLLVSCGHAPATVLEALAIFASASE